MEQMGDRPTGVVRPVQDRLAGAPISWGVCEVPGWGTMLPPEVVLADMQALGLHGTEIGAEGFLPRDPDRLLMVLGRYGLELVGGFVPLVLHEERIDAAISAAREAASLFAAAGAGMFVLAVVQDMAWSTPQPLDGDGWRRLARNVREIETLAGESGLTLALHPHAGTLIETAEQVEQALDLLECGWCLDTGHLLIGGVDPVQFTSEHGERIVHVHLKDVDAALAAQLRSGSLSLRDATRRGLFLPLGTGAAQIGAVLRALDAHGYDRWLVLEQDTALSGDEPPEHRGPKLDVKASIEFLNNTARTTEEVHR
jgi:inosose dehydratase